MIKIDLIKTIYYPIMEQQQSDYFFLMWPIVLVILYLLKVYVWVIFLIGVLLLGVEFYYHWVHIPRLQKWIERERASTGT